LLPDPGPGGRSSALTYNLLGPPNITVGDLVLHEPGTDHRSDIIRFNPIDPDVGATLVFYSDRDERPFDLADTGFPSATYENILHRTEDGPESGPNGFVYTPDAGDPGFVAGFAVTYNIRSDPDPVPEPSTLVLLAIGAGSLLSYRWRRKQAPAEQA
jgi:hypothetical protein